MACDFFCVETVGLKTLYVLFFIKLSTRKVHLADVTRNPGSNWVTQQTRNLVVENRLAESEFLIRDRDAKYLRAFGEVFRSGGVRLIQTPAHAGARRQCSCRAISYGRSARSAWTAA
jgi:hypothetical protein